MDAGSFVLTSLRLKNVRCYSRYSIDLDPSMTVLVGDNGTGKTTILDVAATALSTFLRKSDVSARRKIGATDVRTLWTRQGGSLDVQSAFPLEIQAEGVANGRTVRWAHGLNSPKGSLTFKDANELIAISEGIFDKVRSGDPEVVLPVLAYYGTGRLWQSDSRAMTPSLLSRMDGYADCFASSVNERLMHGWLKAKTLAELQTRVESEGLHVVLSAVARCLGLNQDGDASPVIFNLEMDDLAVALPSAGGQRLYEPLRVMSDGYRNTVGLICDIAYRMAALNPALGVRALEAPGVVLIDEVDLHLHPLWQARILGDLRVTFPNVQFIVTTHAPAVISSVRARHIRLLSGGECAQAPSTEVYGGDAGRILVSIMGAPERPYEVEELLRSFYDRLDVRQFDAARDLLGRLERLVGNDDTAFVGARTALSLEEADALYDAD